MFSTNTIIRIQSETAIRSSFVMLPDTETHDYEFDEYRSALGEFEKAKAPLELLRVICKYSVRKPLLKTDFLAESLNNSPSAITKTMKKLEEIGLLIALKETIEVQHPFTDKTGQTTTKTHKLNARAKCYRLKRLDELSDVEKADIAILTSGSKSKQVAQSQRMNEGKKAANLARQKLSVTGKIVDNKNLETLVRQKGSYWGEILAVVHGRVIPKSQLITLNHFGQSPLHLNAESASGVYGHKDWPILKALLSLTVWYHRSSLLANNKRIPENYTPISLHDILAVRQVVDGTTTRNAVIKSLIRINDTKYTPIGRYSFEGIPQDLYGAGESISLVKYISNLSAKPPEIYIDQDGIEQVDYEKINFKSVMFAIKWPEDLFEKLMTENHFAYPPTQISSRDPMSVRLYDYCRRFTAMHNNREFEGSLLKLTTELLGVHRPESALEGVELIKTEITRCINKVCSDESGSVIPEEYRREGNWRSVNLFGIIFSVNFEDNAIHAVQTEDFIHELNPTEHPMVEMIGDTPTAKNLMFESILKPLHIDEKVNRGLMHNASVRKYSIVSKHYPDAYVSRYSSDKTIEFFTKLILEDSTVQAYCPISKAIDVVRSTLKDISLININGNELEVDDFNQVVSFIRNATNTENTLLDDYVITRLIDTRFGHQADEVKSFTAAVIDHLNPKSPHSVDKRTLTAHARQLFSEITQQSTPNHSSEPNKIEEGLFTNMDDDKHFL
ncbi:hypothetical protein A6E01_20785 (plasmid) [Vibrio breoganii]|uniref:Replication initiator protein RctB central region domain-containing protein n=2 Tax=Vibrio TaxID=662 RepID=A0AAN0XZU6_9VIBR|nr:replication initiator protein RctB domain-containing protein [Vibrio breoganii]ANO35650.1 hypothetical protein A6E01_20785 [Vibrio breoganii]